MQLRTVKCLQTKHSPQTFELIHERQYFLGMKHKKVNITFKNADFLKSDFAGFVGSNNLCLVFEALI